ncbi:MULTISPECIES: hypothetical protein [Aphanothece]|uniref:hypothetical protein n=1 Tax=Aphanothece TaxID=1121 RepID=UPI0039855D1A
MTNPTLCSRVLALLGGTGLLALIAAPSAALAGPGGWRTAQQPAYVLLPARPVPTRTVVRTVERYPQPRYVQPDYVQPGYAQPRYVQPRYVETRYDDRRYDDRRYVNRAPQRYDTYAVQTVPYRRESRIDQLKADLEQDARRCNTGRLVGGLLGGGAGYVASQDEGRAWAVPLGALLGSQVGCNVGAGRGPAPW